VASQKALSTRKEQAAIQVRLFWIAILNLMQKHLAVMSTFFSDHQGTEPLAVLKI